MGSQFKSVKMSVVKLVTSTLPLINSLMEKRMFSQLPSSIMLRHKDTIFHKKAKRELLLLLPFSQNKLGVSLMMLLKELKPSLTQKDQYLCSSSDFEILNTLVFLLELNLIINNIKI